MWSTLGSKLDFLIKRKLCVSIRKKFCVGNNVPVIEDDVSEIKIIGNRGGHFTKGGKRIYYPSAYSKFGFSNMIYLSSTQKILVPRGYFSDSIKRTSYQDN